MTGSPLASSPSSSVGRATRHADRLLEISRVLNSTLDLDVLLQYIIETAAEVLECNASSLLLYDEEAGRLRFAAASGSNAEQLADIPVPLDGSIAGRIFTENRPVIVNDVAQDPDHFKKVGEKVQVTTQSLLGVPMRIEETTTGVLEALNKRDGPFTEEDAEVLSVIAAQAAIALRNARQVTALQQANAQLTQLDRLKSDFLALASHELRTPLSVVLGYGAILHEEVRPELHEFVQAVTDAGGRMSDVIDTMQSMEMLRSGSARLQHQSVALHEVFQEAVGALRPLLSEHHVTIDLPPVPIVFQADAERLQSALRQILKNAAQFTPPGGHVTLRGRREAETVQMVVQDTGCGLPGDLTERIFDEFFQAEDHLTRSHGGLGLGLTIAREFVRLHDGRIWAESAGVDQGTTLHIHLPA